MDPHINDSQDISVLSTRESNGGSAHEVKRAEKKRKKLRGVARRAVISQFPSSTSTPDFRTLHRKIDESVTLSPEEKKIVGRPTSRFPQTIFHCVHTRTIVCKLSCTQLSFITQSKLNKLFFFFWDISFQSFFFLFSLSFFFFGLVEKNAFFKGFLRTFAAGYFFKTTVTLVTKIFGGKILGKKKLLEKLAAIYFGEDAIRFALFIGLMSFTYKSILCSLRRYRNKDPVYHKTFAGFLCAAFIFVGDVLRLLIERKDIPNIPHGNVISFTLSQLFIMYGALLRPETVDPKYYKWIKNVGDLHEESLQKVFRGPIGAPFVECSPLWHKHPSCLVHNCTDFFLAIARSSRVYIPVHFLPALLFYPKS
ncbi:hypothetical protein RFI_12743, partial [Reticulomyxa filosa]